MDTPQKTISIDKLKAVFDAEPKKKRAVQAALGVDRQTISKILNGKRGLQAGELLTIAEVCDLNPFELAA